MSRLGLEPRPPAWEASTLEKSHLDSLYAGCSESLLMMRLASLQTSTWLPQCRCIAHGLLSVEGMPEGAIQGRPLQDLLLSKQHRRSWYQSRRGHHYRETWPGSSLYSSRGPRTDMSRPGLKPGPPAWEASTLEKSHLDSLFAGCSEPLLMLRTGATPTSTAISIQGTVRFLQMRFS